MQLVFAAVQNSSRQMFRLFVSAMISRNKVKLREVKQAIHLAKISQIKNKKKFGRCLMFNELNHKVANCWKKIQITSFARHT